MAMLYKEFWFEPGSRLTGIQTGADRVDDSGELLVLASQIQLGSSQDGSVETDFLQSHLPFRCGAFHGVGPDGHPWVVILQVAPASAAGLVGSPDPLWPMCNALDRALGYNPQTHAQSHNAWTRDDLLDFYAMQGMDPAVLDDWSVPDLVRGLLAECCYLPLAQIVAGRVVQCAFPDVDHDCEHNVFRDVFAMWAAGRLTPVDDWPEE